MKSELKLTDEQVSNVQNEGEKIRAKYKDEMDKARADMDREKMGELRKAQDEDMDKAVAGILKPDQTKRLKQIEIQAAGLGAFLMDDVQNALKLTDAQKSEIKDASEGLQKDVRETMQGAFQGGFDRDKMTEAMKKVQTMQSDAVDKVLKDLTDDQKKTWKDLTGEKFELDFGGFGPPGGGRPGRPNRDQ